MQSDLGGAPPHVPSLLLALQRTTHLCTQRIASALADFDLDLGASEVNALANLADGHARTVSQLGTAIGTRPTTLTSVLDRLERRGHIRRSTSNDDRRSVLVELTESGHASAALILRTLANIEDAALREIARSKIANFQAVLDILTTEEP